MRHRFARSEKLKSRKAIGRLFSGRSPSIGQFPLRLIYQPLEEPLSDAPVQFTVSVPKRKFPKATDRNRLRRQTREAWRLHKHRLYQALPEHAPQYAFMVLYVDKEAQPFEEIERAMRGLIRRFRKKHG